MSSLKFHFGLCKFLLIPIQLSAQNPNSINKTGALLIFVSVRKELKKIHQFTKLLQQALQKSKYYNHVPHKNN